MKENNIKTNMLLNAAKSIVSLIFPLITFPYISKILGVDNIGKYNFANSVVSYFILIAGLGISAYSIREGSYLRNNKVEFKKFADQMFSINICSALFAFLLLFLVVLFISKVRNYFAIIIILSIQILFKPFTLEWVFSVFEDYFFITIRSILLNCLSALFLFLFVHNKDDLLEYTFVIVTTNIATDILNFLYARKYYKPSFTSKIEYSKHLKPIFVLFAMAITITIYVNSDITILGLLCDDRTVGIYSVSVKIYTVLKGVLSAIVLVSIPRFSSLIGNKKIEELEVVAMDIYSTLFTFTIPAVLGIILLRKEIILLISDATYIKATTSLSILAITIIFCLGAYFWGQSILVPFNKEMTVFIITIVSAILNIVLNLLLIPYLKENAAAITTLISEGFAFICCACFGRKHIKIERIRSLLFKILIGCMPIIVICFVLKNYISNMILYSVISSFCSALIYILVEIALKNESIISIFNFCKVKVQ